MKAKIIRTVISLITNHICEIIQLFDIILLSVLRLNFNDKIKYIWFIGIIDILLLLLLTIFHNVMVL